MKFNQWTLALASVGIVSLGSIAQAEEQHSIMSAVQSTTLSGYVDTSVNWWAGSRGPASTGLPGRSYDGAAKQDGFNLNAVKVQLEKPLGDENNWSAGYKADLIFGPDAVAYPNGVGAVDASELAIKQAYVALRAPVGNGLDLKLGVWDTIIGYEFFDSHLNPNYSRSYGFALEPLHHTGLLASYKITDMFSVSGGIANSRTFGPNAKDPMESKKTYMAAVSVTLPEGAGAFKNSVISAGYITGRDAGQAENVQNYYVGGTFNTPVEGLTFGFAWDYLEDGSAAAAGGVGESDAYAFALYAGFGKDKWKLNVRGDYAQGTIGSFYGPGPGQTDRDQLASLTTTLDYNLWENVLTRLELRWDRAVSGDKPFGTSDENAFTVALNAVYKF